MQRRRPEKSHAAKMVVGVDSRTNEAIKCRDHVARMVVAVADWNTNGVIKYRNRSGTVVFVEAAFGAVVVVDNAAAALETVVVAVAPILSW